MWIVGLGYEYKGEILRESGGGFTQVSIKVDDISTMMHVHGTDQVIYGDKSGRLLAIARPKATENPFGEETTTRVKNISSRPLKPETKSKALPPPSDVIDAEFIERPKKDKV